MLDRGAEPRLAARDAGGGVARERDEPLRLLRLHALLLDEHRVDLGHGHDRAAVDPAGADVRAREDPVGARGAALDEPADAVRARLRVVARLAQPQQRNQHASRLLGGEAPIDRVRGVVVRGEIHRRGVVFAPVATGRVTARDRVVLVVVDQIVDRERVPGSVVAVVVWTPSEPTARAGRERRRVASAIPRFRDRSPFAIYS